MSGTQNAGAFRTVLWDDFSNGYNWAYWGKPYDGGVYWNGAFSWSAGDVNVRDGEMQVTMTRHDNGWWTGGGFNSMKAGVSIHYGTISFDAKVDEGQGTMAAILLWPAADDHWPPEVDILETPGHDGMQTLHWQGPGGGNWYDAIRTSSYDPSQWHHYDVTWLPDRLTIQVDGRTVAEWTDHIPNEPMGFGVMSFIGTWHEEWMGGAPDSSTPGVVTVHLDNVYMAQWTGEDPGTDAGSPAPPQRAPAWQDAGSGSDSLVLWVSQDYYKGDAQFTVSVDGQQVGGTFTASALHSSGQHDTLTLHGNWGPGAHTVTVNFLNDLWDGTPDTDRNIYVTHAEYNGVGSDALGNGWTGGSFTVQAAAAAPAPSQDAPVDWNAIAAQVMANYQTTGHWYL